MKHALLATVIAMSLSQATIAQTNHAADSCRGIVNISFGIEAIPLFAHPDGIPFDILKFKQKEVNGYKVYVIESGLGARFAPYALKHAEASAEQQRRNHEMLTTNNMWDRTHMKPQPIYALSFKLIGSYSNEWLKVELNGETKEACYIRRNDLYMQFTAWEAIVKPALQVSFDSLAAYDKPNGKELALKEECKTGKILAIENEWMHIHYYYGYDTGKCWIKWKDESGMLLTYVIYEIIR